MFNLDIRSFFHNHIDTNVQLRNRPTSWRLIGIWGFPYMDKKQTVWNTLSFVHTQSSLPWVCIDDFNKIIRPQEKVWGSA